MILSICFFQLPEFSPPPNRSLSSFCLYFRLSIAFGLLCSMFGSRIRIRIRGLLACFSCFCLVLCFFLCACGFMFGCGIRMEDWGVIISQLPWFLSWNLVWNFLHFAGLFFSYVLLRNHNANLGCEFSKLNTDSLFIFRFLGLNWKFVWLCGFYSVK